MATSSATQDAETATLIDQVHALPPEILNKIFDLTFTADQEECIIDRDYQPPVCLQVSRKTRATFAKDYYDCTVFYSTLEDCDKWMQQLTKTHLRILSEIRIISSLVQKCGHFERRSFHSQINNATNYVVPRRWRNKFGADSVGLRWRELFKLTAIRKSDGEERWLSVDELWKEFDNSRILTIT